MIIFKDLISGDEMFSDTYPIERIHDGAVLKVKGKHVTQSLGVDEALLGANPSAEGGDEGGDLDEASVSGVDVILAHRLVETQFDKKSYQIYIKEYMKNVKARLEEDQAAEIPKFMKGAAAFMKEMMGEFKEFQFFLGEKMDPEGQVCLVKWEDDGNPYLYFFKHGLEEEKV